MRDYIKKTELKTKDHQFLEEDPIMVIDFLARLVCEKNTQGISEAQVFVKLPTSLSGITKSQNEAGVDMVVPEDGGILSWSQAIHYLLWNYA